MCGIFGSRGISLDDHISEIKSILSLRGPDHIDSIECKEIDPSLTFIASQLSFVGKRRFPLISSKGDILLANGEIYNYKELFLKSNLLKFNTNLNDFDYILETYTSNRLKNSPSSEDFLKILPELIADYALLLFDQDNFCLYISRDCLGIRPLWFYWNSSNHWAFASEKKILKSIGLAREQIFQVPPGSWSKIELNTNQIHLKWQKHCHYFQEDVIPIRKDLGNEKLSREVDHLHDLLVSSVGNLFNNLDESSDKIGLFFSGGLDSTILYSICEEKTKVIPLIAGIEGSKDLTLAKRYLIEEENNRFIHINITKELIEQNLKKILARLDFINPLDVGIAIPIYFLSKKASENKIKVCLSGQAADELFAGYKRYEDMIIENSTNYLLNKTLWKELRLIAERNIERDDLMASSFGVELRFPYLDLKIVEFITKLPLNFLINISNKNKDEKKVERKIILRNLAKKLNIPNYIAERNKTAIQYGSGTQKLLQKLAQKERLSLNDYLISI